MDAFGKPLLKAQPIEMTDGDGNIRHFILSKFDAVQGREIVSGYPISNMPKLGDYRVSEEMMLKLMSYVAVEIGDGDNKKVLRLGTKELINNHVGDWELLAKIELAMMQYNCSFFRDGSMSNFLESIGQMFLRKISEISTHLSGQSSPQEKPPTTN